MSETYYFFDDQPVYQADWKKTFGAVINDGVICGINNDLFVYADASGMQVKVKSGAAHIKGNFYFSDAEVVLPISAAPTTSGETRYDLVVVEVNWTTKSMTTKVVAGISSATPTLPSLTRTSTIFQIPLARVTASYGDTNVAAAKVLDHRSWALGVYTIPFIIGNNATVISTGVMPVGVSVPVPGKIIKYDIFADASGSITFDIWKDQGGAYYPPTVADTICASGNKPALSSARTITRRVWNEATYINQFAMNWPGFEITKPSVEDPFYGSVLLVNVDSVATIKQVNLTLWIAKSISPLT
jgi:hypothetical protein